MRLLQGAGVALACAALLSLAACAPAGNPVANATVSSNPTVAPTAEATATPVTGLVITTLSVDVYTDDTLTESWLHADRDPAEITALTGYFGIEPTVSSYTEPGEGADNTYEVQSWPGFEIEYIVSAFGPMNFFITVTEATVGGVPISAAGGAQVGDDLQGLAASDPGAASTVEGDPNGDLFRVKLDQIPTGFDGHEGPGADFVAAQSYAPFTTVTTIRAPQKNYGP